MVSANMVAAMDNLELPYILELGRRGTLELDKLLVGKFVKDIPDKLLLDDGFEDIWIWNLGANR